MRSLVGCISVALALGACSNNKTTIDAKGGDGPGSADARRYLDGHVEGLAIQCVSPGDCPGALCCGQIMLNGGAIPDCTIASSSASCTATCDLNVANSCVATDTAIVCLHAADCPGTAPDCCDLPVVGPVISVCVSDEVKGVIGTPCH